MAKPIEIYLFKLLFFGDGGTTSMPTKSFRSSLYINDGDPKDQARDLLIFRYFQLRAPRPWGSNLND